MTECFGIDLGTTNSVIARLDGGKPVPLSIDGSPIVPSVVLYGADGIAVGRAARNLHLMHPELTVRSAKRRMGTDHRYRVGGVEVTPEQVSAEVLKALKHGAEAQLGCTIRDVVITVPAYFDDAQRRATLSAGELAGFNVLRLLNEPTSASLIYEQVAGTDLDTPQNILVYDLGGGTFDVSVLEVFGGVREVRAIAGNSHLGGDDFDELLTRRFLDTIRVRDGLDAREDLAALARLERLAEETKIELSSKIDTRVTAEFLGTAAGKAIHLDLTMTRHELEDLLGPLLHSTVELTRKAVADAGLTPDDISSVCLVGGSTRIPMVRRMLENEFSAPIHEEIDPDLAVGLGAAVQAGLLQGVEVSRILVDVAAHSLGIRTLDPESSEFEADHFAPVLRCNTALPATRAEEFYTVVEDQERLEVEVFQGESARVSDNTRVGAFMFPLREAPEHSPVRVEFSYDLNGVVKVSVSQPGTDNAKTVAMSLSHAAEAQQSPAAAPLSAVERKGRALLGSLAGASKERLAALLDGYAFAIGAERDRAEEALLDFFLDHEGAEHEGPG